jgi:hypothetical protein
MRLRGINSLLSVLVVWSLIFAIHRPLRSLTSPGSWFPEEPLT